MPLQFRSDTGGLLMLESGSLANECCCSVEPTVPDLTSLMRSLSEALHYINTENGLNPEFGGAQGDAWPTQRTAPFLPPAADGEDIPPDFYEDDYLADIQDAYDDLALIIENYNYVKNFFLKTDPFAGAASLANYTGADDYNPGVINAGNFDAIRAAIVSLINDIINVMVQAVQVVDCCKGAESFHPAGWMFWPNMQACASAIIDSEACGESSFTEGVGCLVFDVAECAATQIQGIEFTTFIAPTNNGVGANLSVVSGHVEVDLTNFPAAQSSGIYLLSSNPSVTLSFSALGPVSIPDVYQNYVTPTLGGLYVSPTLTNSDQKLAFTFIGPTPAGPAGSITGSMWQIDDAVAILTRAQTHVAS